MKYKIVHIDFWHVFDEDTKIASFRYRFHAEGFIDFLNAKDEVWERLMKEL